MSGGESHSAQDNEKNPAPLWMKRYEIHFRQDDKRKKALPLRMTKGKSSYSKWRKRYKHLFRITRETDTPSIKMPRGKFAVFQDDYWIKKNDQSRMTREKSIPLLSMYRAENSSPLRMTNENINHSSRISRGKSSPLWMSKEKSSSLRMSSGKIHSS